MSYEVVREPEALAQAARSAKDDPDGVRQVFTAVDCADLLRIHVGPDNVLYEIDDRQIRVTVIHLGRLR